MKNEYAFFPGCVIPTRFPQSEKSARQVLGALDIQLLKMEGITCCGDPIATQSLNIDMWITIAARNLCIAEKMNKDVITICSGCFEVLKETYNLLKENNTLKDQVNKRLAKIGYEYKGTSNVFHYLEILSKPENLEKIKKLTIRPLKNLIVSAHYGCHLIRPSRTVKFENPERPVTMDEIIQSLGAKTVDTPEKQSCCGYCVKLDESVGQKLVTQKITDLQRNHVDLMSVVCPSCLLQYNQTQHAVNKLYDQKSDNEKTDTFAKLNTPILFLTELMAIAFGMPVQELGLNKRAIKTTEFLSKI